MLDAPEAWGRNNQKVPTKSVRSRRKHESKISDCIEANCKLPIGVKHAVSLSPALAVRQRSINQVVPLFVHIVHVLTEYLVHREHMYLFLLEHGFQRLITPDHTLVAWVLQIMRTNIGPDTFDRLRSGKLFSSVSRGPATTRAFNKLTLGSLSSRADRAGDSHNSF